MKLLILVNSLDCLGDNDALLTCAFRRFGWRVILGEINAIAADDYRYFTRGVLLQENAEPYSPGATAPGTRETYFLDECQLIWVLGSPQACVYRDVWRMLWLASQQTPFVNSIEGLMFLNSKHAMGYLVPKENRAFSYVSNDFTSLWERYQQAPDQWWVAKPPNSGCGENVFLLPQHGPNVRAILQCLTGNTVAQATMDYGALGGFKAQYAILQKFIPEVAQGEKRIIFTCGKVVAWHGRQGAADDHRSNMTQGGMATPADLNSNEIELAESIGQKLMTHGINFGAIDMAYPYVIEFDLDFPGGLYDAKVVSGVDRSDQVAKLIIARFKKHCSRDSMR
ncbi:RimK family alpha-L-glutamate ligase [Mesorhizobium sp. VK23B]|uniref:RimK family alpha-L-glutamate ligase n=1 Tax=Mesorhizobium dulcispinae TaxID=3072316 RepID=A0ABU4XRQ8_9HYPH|nr:MULTISPECIES: RimK family alpha-L-glutamate ligase [unclassified Mesorhizobium]MDX8470337.1 RimK family alpha-L-glutamate ligase [Mesorhizobium sp. VK23B]MDX8476723.1 RimK family alpha-L-glutamate ligase [Mesorhizobium sp. VK23A]